MCKINIYMQMNLKEFCRNIKFIVFFCKYLNTCILNEKDYTSYIRKHTYTTVHIHPIRIYNSAYVTVSLQFW